MEEEDLERLSLRGPAATEQRMIDNRAEYRKALATAADAAERNQLNKMIAAMNRGLRNLRKKKIPPALYYDLDGLTDRERVMARLAKKLGRGRNVIYHGTRRLADVLRAGKLVPPLESECAVFFSRSAEVAAYFSYFLGDKEDQLSPGVLVLDRDSLAHSYRIEPNRYDEFSDRNEREEAIWHRIVNIRRHLLGVVREADITAIIGPPKQPYLPRNFMHWTQARRDAFYQRRMRVGYNFVQKGRAKVHDCIIREREQRRADERVISSCEATPARPSVRSRKKLVKRKAKENTKASFTFASPRVECPRQLKK
jgi:hypothetical protein